MSPAIVVVAKDVRGVEKRVVIDDSGTSIDDVRRAVARAYGVENHRARCYLVDGDDRELRGGSSWLDRCGKTSRVCVVGFARAASRRRAATATETPTPTPRRREDDVLLKRVREDVARTTTGARASSSFVGVDALDRLRDVWAAKKTRTKRGAATATATGDGDGAPFERRIDERG